MFEMICNIPENVGWAMVGAAGMLCVVMFIKLSKVIVETIKLRREDDEEGS